MFGLLNYEHNRHAAQHTDTQGSGAWPRWLPAGWGCVPEAAWADWRVDQERLERGATAAGLYAP